MALPPAWPASCIATCQPRWAAEKEAVMERTGLGLAAYSARQPVTPTRTRQYMPSILPLGSSTITTFLFHQAASPTTEMSSRLTGTGWKERAVLAVNPVFCLPRRKFIPTACQTSRHPVEETGVVWVSPSRISTMSPEHTSACCLGEGLGVMMR